MEPIRKIELAAWTVIELVTLFAAIEAELRARKAKSGERSTSFVERERLRRAQGRARTR